MKTPIYTFIFFILLLLLPSCKGDTAKVKIDEVITEGALQGKWEIAKAFKDGKLSRLLDKGKVTITEEGTFTTNIFGDPKAYPFELRGNTMRVATPKASKYVVSEVTPDTLKMSTKFRNFEFKLITTRVK